MRSFSNETNLYFEENPKEDNNKKMENDETITLSVFFGGTSSSFAHRSTQVEHFGLWCKGEKLNNTLDYKTKIEKGRSFKMLFDGW